MIKNSKGHIATYGFFYGCEHRLFRRILKMMVFSMKRKLCEICGSMVMIITGQVCKLYKFNLKDKN